MFLSNIYNKKYMMISAGLFIKVTIYVFNQCICVQFVDVRRIHNYLLVYNLFYW